VSFPDVSTCNTREFISKNRYLRQLNIDKDLLTMRNFDVYDPMKRGSNVVLDGQTLAHVEVGFIPFFINLSVVMMW
jgi:hypothetical protein